MKPSGLLVFKNGKKGAQVWCQGQLLSSFPGYLVRELVDTTGAGDAFNAGFLHRMMCSMYQKPRRMDKGELILLMQDALRWGCASGAIRVSLLGASDHAPGEGIVKELIRTGNVAQAASQARESRPRQGTGSVSAATGGTLQQAHRALGHLVPSSAKL